MLLLFAAPRLLFPVGAFICHQRPERSFFFHGQQLPVCARCTGLYAGAALAAPIALVAAVAMTRSRARRLLLVAALPTAITWTLEFAHVMPFSNAARFLAALPLGFAAAWLVFTVMRSASNPPPRSEH
jgi:uncharacterized membrane protein